MKKRWFVVILTIGLLLCVLPPSVLALSPDHITDADGNLLDWSDLSTVSYSLDDSKESGDKESGDEELEDKESGDEESDDKESGDDTPADDTDSTTPPEKNLASNEAAADGDGPADDNITDWRDLPTTLDEELEDDALADDTDSTAVAVCKIGEETYSTLELAISKAQDGDQIDLLRDIEWDEGLTFDNKTLTISGGGHKLTLEENGMYALDSDITFENLTLNIHAHTHTHEYGAGATANLISDSKLRLNNVYFTLSPDTANCGSGIYLLRYSNLYLNNTTAEIHGFSGDQCSGIYADESNIGPNESVKKRKIELDSSTLTVTDCGWNGMTINKVDLDLTNSHVYLNHNAKGGLGTYWGKLTMKGSTLTADENGNSWGLFVGQLDMDGNSTLNACNNGSNGIVIGGRGVIQKGAKLNCNSNDYIGLYVFLDRNNGWYGDVVIEDGAIVTARENGYSGVHNSNKLEIEGTVIADSNKLFGITNDAGDELIITNTAEVSARQNLVFGIFNYDNAKLTVESDASLKVEENTGSGILNGRNATLNLNAGSIKRNNARYGINYGYVAQGGGIQNWGTAILSDDVELYNNHTTSAGDDIYNADVATITFGDTGRGWELDGGPDCYDFITGWYDDSQNARWRVHVDDEADLHAKLVEPGTELTGFLALKAAHGIRSTGSLTVRKETTGELLPSDYDTAFTFELTLDDDTITTIDDQWCGVPFKNGKASFTLKSGESITLSNLPAGIGYTITEAAQDDWTLVNINDAETGVVPRNDTAEVVFTNLKNSLDIPDVPILPIEPEEPEKPEGPETPKETEETEVPAQNTTAETLIQTGTTDWLAAVLLISGFGLLVCGWFFNRKQRSAKH